MHNTKYLKDYLPPAYLIPKIELEFELDASRTLVRSKLFCTKNSKNPEKTLELNGEQLELLEVKLNGQILSSNAYQLNKLLLSLENPGDEFELEILTAFSPEQNLSGEGLYLSGKTLTTQMEAEGFRRVTYFPDRPDVMSSYQVRLIGDKALYPQLLSNGNLIEQTDLPDGRHQALWQDPFPKPCYLFALVAGDLELVSDTFRTRSGRQVSLEFYVEPGKGKYCQHAVDSLKKSMQWDEEVFGLEYDLDVYMIVAVDAFNSGAMENKGLNIFNTKYVLADRKSATDADFLGVETVIAHEYFHNWTGNRVTCRDWFQLTLKEGLTVLRDNLFSEDLNSAGVTRIQNVRKFREIQFAEDSGPNRHPIRPDSYIEINNFYTATVYEKGSEVIRMLYTLYGRELFTKGITRYFELYDGQAVTTEDFLNAMQQAIGADLSQFSHWYHQAGTPRLKVTAEYDLSRKSYRLNFSQQLDDPKHKDQPLLIPIKLALFSVDGHKLQLQTEHPDFSGDIFSFRKHSDSIEFLNIENTPVASLLRGFSAPVKLDFDYSPEQLLTLAMHDDDDFVRYDATQALLLGALRDMVQNPGRSTAPEVLKALGLILNSDALDTQLRAELLSMPALEQICSEMPAMDFQIAEQAQQRLLSDFALQYEQDLLRLYERLSSELPEEFDLSPQSMGIRKLRNVCLRVLCILEKQEYFDLLSAHYQSSQNMTDSFAALLIISDFANEFCEQISADFLAKWGENALVLDKWFMAQANSRRSDTLDRVRNLARHPKFDIKNPNKLRALYACFARNLPRFHAADGSGYELLADLILIVDSFNPQVAARLCNSFQLYGKLTAKNNRLLEVQLKRILDAPGISDGVFELVSKTLQ